MDKFLIAYKRKISNNEDTDASTCKYSGNKSTQVNKKVAHPSQENTIHHIDH